MAFFDWLDEVQEFARSGIPKRKPSSLIKPGMEWEKPGYVQEPGGEAAPVFGRLLDLGGRPETRINMGEDQGPKFIPEDRAAKLQKRNKLESDIKNKALALVKEIVHSQTWVGKEAKGALAEKEAEYTDSIYRQGAGGIARATRDALKRLGVTDPKYDQAVAQLEEQESQALRLVEETPPAPPPSPGSAKLEGVSRNVMEAQNALKYAVTQEQIGRLQATIDSGLKILGQSDKEAQAARPEIEDPEIQKQRQSQLDEVAKKGERQAAFTGDDGTPGRDSIFEIFDSLSPNGMGRKELAKQARRALEIIGKSAPLDPMSKVSFWVALPAYAEALGQEAYARTISPLARMQKELQDSQKGIKKLKAGAEEQEGASQARISELEEKQRNIAHMANDRFLNTPLGVVLFILSSLVLGPSMSSFIFTRSSNRGKLQAEWNQVGEELKRERERMLSSQKMQDYAARQAVESQDRFGLAMGEAAERSMSKREDRVFEHYYRMKEINARVNKSDPAQKALADGFTRQESLARRAQANVTRYNEEVKELRNKLTEPMVQDKAMLRAALIEATKNLQTAEAELQTAEARMDGIDRLLYERYGISAGATKEPAEDAGGK